MPKKKFLKIKLHLNNLKCHIIQLPGYKARWQVTKPVKGCELLDCTLQQRQKQVGLGVDKFLFCTFVYIR